MTQPQPLDLDQIEARANAATPGPWCTDSWEIYQGTKYEPGLSAWIGETCRGTSSLEQDRADAAFVAAARTDVPAMAAEIRRLRAELAEARANGIRYAAELVTLAFHSEPFLSYPPDFAHLLREHADRLTAAARKAAVEREPAAEETHVVADDSNDPEHTDDCPGCVAAPAARRP